METPLAYTIAEVCKLSKTGRTAVYTEIKSGALRAVKRGRRTLVRAEDLQKWMRNLPEIASTSPQSPAV
jgi:excisionase family DNA binding protein